MEMGEAVGVGVANVNEQAPSCDHQEKKDKYGWKARVNGLGQDSTKCSGNNLFESMKPRKKAHCEKKGLGFVPEKKENDYWKTEGLAVVGPENFPLQAHHLIPKNFLPKHRVCVWLCKKYDGDDDYQLIEDTYYNTDHENNGYAMPDALRLKEWKEARDDDEKCQVAFRVMENTGVQLHQGSHAETLDVEKINTYLKEGKLLPIRPVAPAGDSDELEESEIHEPGYLDPIKQWLNAAAGRIFAHVATCTEGCRKDSSGKTEVRPLDDSVRLMNQVSYITKVFLTMNTIFTCPYGAAYAVEKDLLVWDEETKRYKIRKRTDKGIEDVTKADLSHALKRS